MDSAIALDRVLRASVNAQAPLVPSTGMSRSSSYNSLAGLHAREYATGALVRINREDLFDLANMKLSIEQLLADLRLRPQEIDLVVDLGVLREEDEQVDLDLSMRTIPELPYLDRWRSFWFSGGSFPEFLTSIEPNSEEYIPRVEWTLWSGLVRGLRTRRVPRFSDYGVAHPISPDVNLRVMNMSANVRYTTDHHWLVVKGRGTLNHGYGQFNELCRKLVALPEFSGRRFSDGDTYLDNCASDNAGPGNASKWRQAGTSHHIAYATLQVEEAKRFLG